MDMDMEMGDGETRGKKKKGRISGRGIYLGCYLWVCWGGLFIVLVCRLVV